MIGFNRRTSSLQDSVVQGVTPQENFSLSLGLFRSFEILKLAIEQSFGKDVSDVGWYTFPHFGRFYTK